MRRPPWPPRPDPGRRSPARRGAGRRIQALGQEPVRGLALGRLVEARQEQLDDLGRLDPAERLLAGQDPLPHHVDRDLHRGRGGALGRSRLEHVQLAALDRELEVLDVAVVALQALGDLVELLIHLRQLVAHLADLGRGPDAGHHVLALRVGQVLAVEDLLARCSGRG